MRLLASARALRPPPYAIHLDAPLTARSLVQIAATLPQNLIGNLVDPSLENTPELPKSAAVLIALTNVDDKPGLIVEVRGKLRTHSGELRCAFFGFIIFYRHLFRIFTLSRSFPGGKVDEVRESIQ